MINTTRRKFLRDATVTATGVCLTSQLGAKKKEFRADVIECAPRQTFALLATISTVQSGNWSDPATWGGKLPQATDIPLISSGHTVTFDLTTANYAGVSISSGATLQFASNKSTTLQSSGNVVVEGKLTMRPSSASVIQTLRFVNIDESKFVGGGMDVIGADVGLWAMGAGLLDLAGAPKTAFVRAAGNISSGTANILLNTSPAGWQVGDEITIAPTESPTVGSAYTNGFEDRTITSISGSSITLNAGTVRAHPKINIWTAEVINLTRNVRIEGTATGRTHIFIRTSVPQIIKNVQIRYIGPRKNRTGDSTPEFVLGRYGLHFHHCGNGSVGSMIEGCVIRDTGSHSYVPHSSNGITMKGNVAYNFMETAFWWDVLDLTHGITWVENIVAKGSFLHNAADIDNSDAPTFSVTGFILGVGDDNVCNNNVTIGMAGDFRTGGGYFWQEGKIESAWEFKGNMAHNCCGGLVTWQNNEKVHAIEDFILYNNEMGIYHGAYSNCYFYRGGHVYNSEIQIKAASANSNRIRFENLIIDAAGLDYAIRMEEGPLDGSWPIFIRNCTIRGHKRAGIINQSPKAVKKVDVIQCNTEATILGGALSLLASAVDYVLSPLAGALEEIRVQPIIGQPYKLTKSGKVTMAPFAPTIWGNGNGLKAEYFNDVNLSKPAFTRTDVSIYFFHWNKLGVHYKITSDSYSIRWTGKVMPHYSEPLTFHVETGGGIRLWVDGKLLIDRWSEPYPAVHTSPQINLLAGQKYDIRLEYFNTDDRSQIGLKWQSASLPLEYVPMGQLFSDPIGSQPNPGNVAPIANAGTDITITMPTNSVTLDGVASRDTDGTIASYAWTKIAGPSQFIINNGASSKPTITGLAAGVYVFRLTVTDDKGAQAFDDVTVTVKAANLGPVSNAGADINITLPLNSTTLNGGASKDPDGTIIKYAWFKVSGPSQFTIADAGAAATALTNLVAGTYVFKLTVTDNNNVTAEDTVNVIVSNSTTPANKPPVADAGPDQAITLPTNTVTLNGTNSKDPDGSITKYAWTKLSGPTSFFIVSPGSAITQVRNLVAGTYVFRLTVTDNKGATANNEITIVVNEAASPGNQNPVAMPGTDITVQLPNYSISLNGSESYDPDGRIISYRWTKISGPATFTLVTPNAATTELRNLVAGTYVFRLTVTDDKGATDSETITVTALDIKQPDLGVLTVVAYPNPSTTTFKLRITSNNTDTIFLHIYDSTGKRVSSLFNLSNNTTVTVGAHWRPGIYTVVTWQGNKTVMTKLLKQ